MTPEPAHRRLARIKAGVVLDRHIALEDGQFLLARLEEAQRMLSAQQQAVSDAAARWQKIGYEEGYAQGYEDAVRSPVSEEEIH